MINRLMFGLVGIAMSLSANPCAAGGDPFLGEIDTFPYNFCPVGWAPLNGQLLQISTPVFAAGDNLWRRWKNDLRTTDRKTSFHVNTGCAGDPMHRPGWHFPSPHLTGRAARRRPRPSREQAFLSDFAGQWRQIVSREIFWFD
jgi:hypothetical protein